MKTLIQCPICGYKGVASNDAFSGSLLCLLTLILVTAILFWPLFIVAIIMLVFMLNGTSPYCPMCQFPHPIPIGSALPRPRPSPPPLPASVLVTQADAKVKAEASVTQDAAKIKKAVKGVIILGGAAYLATALLLVVASVVVLVVLVVKYMILGPLHWLFGG
jgi:hypothetical protein